MCTPVWRGPVPPNDTIRKRGGMLQNGSVRLGGPEVHNTLRARAGDDANGMLVYIYRDSSISLVLNWRRKLKTFLVVIQGIRASVFSVARGLKVSCQRYKALERCS